MKNIMITILSLFLSLSAFAGPRTDGGGIVPGGTDAWTVEFVMPDVPYQLRNYLRSDAGISLQNAIYPPSLTQIWIKMFGSNVVTEDSPIFKALANVKFKIQADKPCQGVEGEVDASTAHVLGAPICVSSLTLKRLSEKTIHQELMALLLHELSHQFGANEDEAKQIQEYFTRRFEIFSNITETQCFSRIFDRSQYYWNLTKISVHRSKRSFLDKIATGLSAAQVRDFASYAPWLLNELKTDDSMLAEQLAGDIYWMTDRLNWAGDSKFEYYNAPNGMSCMRYLHDVRDLRFESAEVVEQKENSQILEVKFGYFMRFAQRRDETKVMSHFSMRLEVTADASGTYTARLKSYPQFVNQTSKYLHHSKNGDTDDVTDE